MKQYPYLAINFACILIPFIFSFYPKYPFFKKWKYFFSANILISIIFIIWDIEFTKMGIWGFNESYLIGITIFNLPIEETLFFICIPYACTFTYFALRKLVVLKLQLSLQKKINIIFAILLAIISIYFNDKIYTFLSLSLTSLLLIISTILNKDFAYIYLTYLITIPFFLLSNGALTGMFSESPIVWYDGINNTEFRVFTIPIEDFIYGFLLISSNILTYEFLTPRHYKVSEPNLKEY